MEQVVSASSGTIRTSLQFTGGAFLTAIGFGQRIEAINSYDLANRTVTLSADLANTLLTTVTWTAYYANTTDVFGTIGSPTKTQIATGTFTVNSTVTRYNTQISVPAAATTGIEIVFTVGAQTSGTWTIGNVQLEPGTVATPFERRSYGQELALCQRYCFVAPANWVAAYGGNSTTGVSDIGCLGTFPATMRAAPTASGVTFTLSNCGGVSSTYLTAGSAIYKATTSAVGGGSFIQTAGTYSAEL
jgi:hypothetical protein